MHELTTTNPTKRMSSMDIADLTQKKHNKVMRDIKSLIDQGAISLSNVGQSTYKNDRGKEYPMYMLDFEATMTLITGYDAKRRSQVVSRWVELEKKKQDPMEALNDPEAMRGILLTYTEKVISLQKEVKEAAPKVEGFDRIAQSDGLTCITDTAKSLQMRPKDLFTHLSATKWIYRRAGGKGWLAYQNRLQQGVLSHKVTTVLTGDGRERIFESVFVTPKGLTLLAKKFQEAA